MTTPDLPPLPEPGRKRLRVQKPACAEREEPLFTSDQMRAYGDARAAAAVLASSEV